MATIELVQAANSTGIKAPGTFIQTCFKATRELSVLTPWERRSALEHRSAQLENNWEKLGAEFLSAREQSAATASTSENTLKRETANAHKLTKWFQRAATTVCWPEAALKAWVVEYCHPKPKLGFCPKTGLPLAAAYPAIPPKRGS